MIPKTIKPMSVGELIQHLLKFDQDLPVAYSCCSEQVLMEAEQISVQEHCEPRPDGWIQNKRPDKPSVPYLLFPGI